MFVTSLAYVAGLLTMVCSTILVTAAATSLAPLVPTTLPAILPTPEIQSLPQQTVRHPQTTVHKTWNVGKAISQLLTLVSLPSLISLSKGSNTDQRHGALRNRTCLHDDEESIHDGRLTESSVDKSLTELRTSHASMNTGELPMSSVDKNGKMDGQSEFTIIGTLHNIFVLFVSSISGSIRQAKETTSKQMDPSTGANLLCAEGPCPRAAKQGCRNITMNTGSHMTSCRNCDARSVELEQNCPNRCVNGNKPVIGGKLKGCTMQICDDLCAALVHCCCSEEMMASVDWGGSLYDISLGFHTHNQFVVTF